MYAKISYEIILQTKFTEIIIIHIIYGVHIYNVVELQMPWLLCLLHTIFDVHIYNVVELHMPRLLCLLHNISGVHIYNVVELLVLGYCVYYRGGFRGEGAPPP